MRNVIKIILFLIYTSLIFFAKNYIFLILVLILNILFMAILKINKLKAICNLLKLAPIIALTIFLNGIFIEWKASLLIGSRIILVCNTTYIFSRKIGYSELAESIEKIFYPLKIFKIKPQNISIMVCLGIAFIPIIREEIIQIGYALEAKGIKGKKRIVCLFYPLLISNLKRVREIEKSLKARGYQE